MGQGRCQHGFVSMQDLRKKVIVGQLIEDDRVQLRRHGQYDCFSIRRQTNVDIWWRINWRYFNVGQSIEIHGAWRRFLHNKSAAIVWKGYLWFDCHFPCDVLFVGRPNHRSELVVERVHKVDHQTSILEPVSFECKPIIGRCCWRAGTLGFWVRLVDQRQEWLVETLFIQRVVKTEPATWMSVSCLWLTKNRHPFHRHVQTLQQQESLWAMARSRTLLSRLQGCVFLRWRLRRCVKSEDTATMWTS